MTNRRPVTIRFSEDEYEALQQLAYRFGGDVKKVLKFAFALLAESTGKLEQRVKDEKLWESQLAPPPPEEPTSSE
jgi:hypothetical protein